MAKVLKESGKRPTRKTPVSRCQVTGMLHEQRSLSLIGLGDWNPPAQSPSEEPIQRRSLGGKRPWCIAGGLLLGHEGLDLGLKEGGDATRPGTIV
jgi:hypothetical protein